MLHVQQDRCTGRMHKISDLQSSFCSQTVQELLRLRQKGDLQSNFLVSLYKNISAYSRKAPVLVQAKSL
jgi:hypothetical protein